MRDWYNLGDFALARRTELGAKPRVDTNIYLAAKIHHFYPSIAVGARCTASNSMVHDVLYVIINPLKPYIMWQNDAVREKSA